MKSNGDDRDIDKIEESEKPHIHPFQTLRHFGTMNADLHAGILAYSALSAAAPILAPVGFVGAMIGTHKVADTLLKKVIPYEHETSFNYSTHT